MVTPRSAPPPERLAGSAKRPRVGRASVVFPALPFVVAMVMMLIGIPIPNLLGFLVPMRPVSLKTINA
jgi:hypothetical protein